MDWTLPAVWQQEGWATEEIVWPDLSKNPYLNESFPEKRDPGFEASLSKVTTNDKRLRSIQKFRPLDELDDDSKSFVETGYLEKELDISELLDSMSSLITETKNMDMRNSLREYGRSEWMKGQSKSYGILTKLLQDNNVLNAVANMYGRPKSLVGTSLLHYSDDTDIHFKQVLSDVDYSPKLQALHRDPKPSVKAILYLEDVDEKDGPFSVIPYSHRWSCPYKQRMASHANCTYNYLDSPKTRKAFLSLPEDQRITSILGSVTDDSDDLCETLLKQEKTFTGKAGKIICFPASGTMHRGGICGPGGSRLNLQITFSG